MERLIINSKAYYDLLVKPHFADLNPKGEYPGTLGEFTIMDDVSSKRKIIDILGGGNILKRRDASCDIIYTPVAEAKTRTIEVDKIYGATKNCEEEFYIGCLEDFQNQSATFRDYVLNWFKALIKKDINSNAYFGNIERADDPNGIWSWNVFDGVFKWYARYITQGVIHATQTSSIPSGTLTPTDCYNVIKWAYGNQNVLMRSLPVGLKAFYVSQSIADGYEDYLINVGGANNIQYYTNGVPQLHYKQIPILVEPTWNPIMSSLNGGVESHACILTIRGNFTFATDKKYGGGPQGDQALKVWFNEDEETWKYLAKMKAGTQIALPEHSVIGLTTIN